jgi:hypothetical protein
MRDLTQFLVRAMDVLTPQWSTQCKLKRSSFVFERPVTIGSLFGDWVVTWDGRWTRDRLSSIVMVASDAARIPHRPSVTFVPPKFAHR